MKLVNLIYQNKTIIKYNNKKVILSQDSITSTKVKRVFKIKSEM